MDGARVTTNSPEVEAVGTVIVMEVSLHEVTGTAAPFSSTALPPWVTPKPEPESTTVLPTDPVVGEMALNIGELVPFAVTETLSNVAVAREVAEGVATPKPM